MAGVNGSSNPEKHYVRQFTHTTVMTPEPCHRGQLCQGMQIVVKRLQNQCHIVETNCSNTPEPVDVSDPATGAVVQAMMYKHVVTATEWVEVSQAKPELVAELVDTDNANQN